LEEGLLQGEERMTIEDELKKEIALLTSLNQQLTHQLYDYRAAFMRARDREWVGFTHEELAWLNEALNLGGRFAVIEAIEAKLKEKNNG
jgi:hypothetical protein